MLKMICTAFVLLATFAVPARAMAQRHPQMDGGVVNDAAVRAVAPLPAHVLEERAPRLVPSQGEDPVAACFRECFRQDGSLRDRVCAAVPDPGACLGLQIPACVRAARAYAAGRGVLEAAHCPAAPAAAASAPTEASDATRRRQQQERAAEQACRSEGGFEAACRRCSMLSGFRWISVGSGLDSQIVRIAMGGDTSPAAEAYFRCQSARIMPYHRLLADTRRQVDSLRTRVDGLGTQVAMLRTAGQDSPEMARVIDRLIGAIIRLDQHRQLDRSQAALDRCLLEVRVNPNDHPSQPTTCDVLRNEVASLVEGIDEGYAQGRGYPEPASLQTLREPLNGIMAACRGDGDPTACAAARNRFREALGLAPIALPAPEGDSAVPPAVPMTQASIGDPADEP